VKPDSPAAIVLLQLPPDIREAVLRSLAADIERIKSQR
jgi:hypothetical protein